MNTLKKRLRDFKLAGILPGLEQRLQYAQKQSIGHLEFLELFCEDEENSRRQNSYNKRYAKSKFPSHKNKADNSYYKKLQCYLETHLLILDKLGFKKLPAFAADDFVEFCLFRDQFLIIVRDHFTILANTNALYIVGVPYLGCFA